MVNIMENLFDFIFWYNPYEKIWYAINRDTQLNFFNGNRDKSLFYKSKEISTLTQIISNDKILEKLTKGEQ
jgi:hypothetical protein